MTQEAAGKKVRKNRMIKTRKNWLLFTLPVIIISAIMAWITSLSEIINILFLGNYSITLNDQGLLIFPFCFIFCAYLYIRVLRMSDEEYQKFRTKWHGQHPLHWGIYGLLMGGLVLGGYLLHDELEDLLKVNGYTLCTEDDDGLSSSQLWVRNSAWEICIDERYT